ncbi:phage major capsid protein [Fusobacterium varium]|jgi:HK97 family phage major capsid protein|uniref:phage major capsid protein n=1 Tax=Fusobacterium varium TaxID=856 RepID=UPI001F206374|nr:phage major capsid protein [Fusobacterium varium]MCF2672899.1 phage major capsid protein [Fusobacterium varium]
MKKSVELRKEAEEMRNKIKNLKAENKIEEAHGMLQSLKDIENKIREAELEESLNAEGGEKKPVTNKKEMNINRIYNRVLLGKSVSEEEMAFLNAAGTPGQVEATDGKGGYLVPTEQFTQIKELRRTLVSLKTLCNIVPVTSFKGTMPIEKDGTGELIAFEELNEIDQSDVDFAQVAYNTADYGDIIPISNTLLADEKANLITYIGKRFNKKAVNTENKKIIALLNTLTPKTVSDYKGIITTLNKDLDPAISQNAVIITNQTYFDILDQMEDKQGRPLLTVSLQDETKKLFKGRPIIVLLDTLLPMKATKAPVFVGDMTEFATFFDREGLELAVSSEAGFTKNATLIRAIERFDVKKVDGKAMVYLEVGTTA